MSPRAQQLLQDHKDALDAVTGSHTAEQQQAVDATFKALDEYITLHEEFADKDGVDVALVTHRGGAAVDHSVPLGRIEKALQKAVPEGHVITSIKSFTVGQATHTLWAAHAALKNLCAALASTMPAVRTGVVQDYALINDAPLVGQQVMRNIEVMLKDYPVTTMKEAAEFISAAKEQFLDEKSLLDLIQSADQVLEQHGVGTLVPIRRVIAETLKGYKLRSVSQRVMAEMAPTYEKLSDPMTDVTADVKAGDPAEPYWQRLNRALEKNEHLTHEQFAELLAETEKAGFSGYAITLKQGKWLVHEWERRKSLWNGPCNNFKEDQSIADSTGEPKGQCEHCGYKEWDHQNWKERRLCEEITQRNIYATRCFEQRTILGEIKVLLSTALKEFADEPWAKRVVQHVALAVPQPNRDEVVTPPGKLIEMIRVAEEWGDDGSLISVTSGDKLAQVSVAELRQFIQDWSDMVDLVGNVKASNEHRRQIDSEIHEILGGQPLERRPDVARRRMHEIQELKKKVTELSFVNAVHKDLGTAGEIKLDLASLYPSMSDIDGILAGIRAQLVTVVLATGVNFRRLQEAASDFLACSQPDEPERYNEARRKLVALLPKVTHDHANSGPGSSA